MNSAISSAPMKPMQAAPSPVTAAPEFAGGEADGGGAKTSGGDVVRADSGQGVPAGYGGGTGDAGNGCAGLRNHCRICREDFGRDGWKTADSGLGLAIVKNAVILHGGSISATNITTGGLRFDFTLGS